jgi:hypothetical protein
LLWGVYIKIYWASLIFVIIDQSLHHSKFKLRYRFSQKGSCNYKIGEGILLNVHKISQPVNKRHFIRTKNTLDKPRKIYIWSA